VGEHATVTEAVSVPEVRDLVERREDQIGGNAGGLESVTQEESEKTTTKVVIGIGGELIDHKNRGSLANLMGGGGTETVGFPVSA